MSFRCDSCSGSFAGEPAATTAIGRELCEACNDQFLGLAAGLLTGGPDAAGSVANAVSTGGWFARIKRSLRGR